MLIPSRPAPTMQLTHWAFSKSVSALPHSPRSRLSGASACPPLRADGITRPAESPLTATWRRQRRRTSRVRMSMRLHRECWLSSAREMFGRPAETS